MNDLNKFAGVNINEPVINVFHQHLKIWDEESLYKRICPKCGGILPVLRSSDTLEIIPEDYCFLCGQHYYYLDYKEIDNGPTV